VNLAALGHPLRILVPVWAIEPKSLHKTFMSTLHFCMGR
jgi:hypothetical protein